MLVSCSKNEMNIDVPDTDTSEQVCQIVVTLRTSETTQISHLDTRADTWGDPYPEEEGLPDEQAIKNLHLYLSTDMGNVFPIVQREIEVDEGEYRYIATIPVNPEYVSFTAAGDPILTANIVAIANVPSDYVPANPFTCSPVDLSIIENEKIIPMWGVTRITDLPLVINQVVHSNQTIQLLRAVPKITFELDDEIKDLFEIVSITSENDFEQTGFCQPRNATGVNFTTSLGIESCFNPALSNTGRINRYYGMGSDKVWLYTGERTCNPGGAAAMTPYFTVTLMRRDGSGLPIVGNVYLSDYKKGEPNTSAPFSRLVRNHDYVYRISLAELKFVISFEEWIFGGKVHIELQ